MRDLLQTSFLLRKWQNRKRGTFLLQKNIVQSSEGLSQHEVLVNHADFGVHSIDRRVKVNRLAVKKDFTFIGTIESEEDLHGCGFAGAVFADNAVNTTRCDCK